MFGLPLGDGRSVRVLYEAPPHPRAALVMLPGGTGALGIGRGGTLRHGDNFVVRTRADWVARGDAVLIPDTIDRENLRGRRASASYGEIVNRLAALARARSQAPVFLLATSQGTIAATSGAAHAPPGLLAGIVLTEPVSVPGRRSRETVFDTDPAAVRVPVLIVVNRADACDVAPPALAPRIAAALAHAPGVAVLAMNGGGTLRSESPCGSRSPHGYEGIETQVVEAIGTWLQSHGG